ELGCFGMVLEKIPAGLAKKVSEAIDVPTIGIGGGGDCDGQVLVTHDMLGITKDFHPRFLRRYVELFDVIKDATERYVEDVKAREFPNDKEQY
ncbi:MAG: 3-methyl-2-oxobutanoate hydroxymethyltransferase, partial [Bacteroidota bacterium]